MADNDLDPLWQDLDWYVTYTPIHPPIVSGPGIQRMGNEDGGRAGIRTRPLGVLLADIATTGLSGRC